MKLFTWAYAPLFLVARAGERLCERLRYLSLLLALVHDPHQLHDFTRAERAYLRQWLDGRPPRSRWLRRLHRHAVWSV